MTPTKTVAALEPGRSLDVGCDAGGLVLALASHGWKAAGMDITANAIASAHAVMAKHEVTAELEVGDASTWTPDGQFDLITNCFALSGDQSGQHRAVRMMVDALAPGGMLVLKDFDSSMHATGHFKGFYLPTVAELRECMEGLEIVAAEVVGTPVHTHADQPAHQDQRWTAAWIVARKP
ncbi:MAG: 2-polyprenyl-3-methyl-5-hydroxy-6-metoxy-1,4-benzoquinol methylase [Myxococcota bacterium]|jgi:2-polyprenyl-3-methyl-5-hydroxy-6-metoxy-1,4-benzoquinol methylase